MFFIPMSFSIWFRFKFAMIILFFGVLLSVLEDFYLYEMLTNNVFPYNYKIITIVITNITVSSTFNTLS